MVIAKFSKHQEIVKIGDVRLGGQPGQLPTVLIGSVFHRGHKVVKDPYKGEIDEREAERQIKIQEESSDLTGNPPMVDVVGETTEALCRYLDFVSSVTDVPLLLNGVSPEVRAQALKHAGEVGLTERIVYTSISLLHRPIELEAIRTWKPAAVLIQTFNPKDLSPFGASSTANKLMTRVAQTGLRRFLILASVLDIPQIGISVQCIHKLKETFGLPVGSAPLGVIGTWKRAMKLGPETKRICRASVLALTQVAGGNFVIYGSIKKARKVFPPCAITDSIIAYGARQLGIEMLTKSHPLYKIL